MVLTKPEVLILTPAKNATAHVKTYLHNLERLSYPREQRSLGILVSDSHDTTFSDLQQKLSCLEADFQRVELFSKDFGYHLPDTLPRWTAKIQLQRRSILARSRNHLLFRTLKNESWVLWLDIDVIEYPEDIIERLLATGKNIVQPNCVLEYGGVSYDQNAWRGSHKLLLSDLRQEADLVRLDSVGGTMLLVQADLHRDGLIFPSFPYNPARNIQIPADVLRIETEGFGLMAKDMGHQAWGLPRLEICHYKG